MDLEHFEKKREFVLCVDSDGCAMDTMNVKHIRCFGPCMVTEWGLEEWSDQILARWNEINLTTATRGINRFKGLALALSEIDEQYKRIDGIGVLRQWAEEAPELSEPALQAEIGKRDEEVLRKALHWSKKVNEAITALPWDAKKAFPGVREGFETARAFAEIVVVSSANREAVEEEWEHFGLSPLVDLVMCQDMGSKAHCIGELIQKGYAKDHILMVGDAPGDEKAAADNGVFYFPILAGREEESWELLRKEALDVFHRGTYAGAYQEERKTAFWNNLGKK